MRLLLALIFFGSALAAETPLPITTIGTYDMFGWSVMCSNIDSPSPHCRAERKLTGGCLRMSFAPDEAHAQLLEDCRDDEGPRKTLALPLDSAIGPSDATEELFASKGIDPEPIMTEKFVRELRYVAIFMFKLTNG